MSVVNTKSTAVTNADAATQTNSSQKIAGGRLRESVGAVAVANGDSIGSTLRLARIHSGDRISRVLLSCTAITSAEANVGLYDVMDVNSGAVVDADLFASAQSLATAQNKLDITRESAVIIVADAEKQVWQLLGLPADPCKYYDIVATLTVAATAVGAVALNVQYVNGN